MRNLCQGQAVTVAALDHLEDHGQDGLEVLVAVAAPAQALLADRFVVA